MSSVTESVAENVSAPAPTLDLHEIGGLGCLTLTR